jgi:hypothetical protein
LKRVDPDWPRDCQAYNIGLARLTKPNSETGSSMTTNLARVPTLVVTEHSSPRGPAAGILSIKEYYTHTDKFRPEIQEAKGVI